MAVLQWLFRSLLISTLLITLSQATDEFSLALFSLKSDLLDHTSSLSTWVLPNTTQEENPSSSSVSKIEACSWSGVSCNSLSTMVTGLDLSGRALSGQISGQHFKTLVDLKSLNLSHNSFSGSIPLEIFNLTKLSSLDISRNNFSGHFPTVYGLKSLVVLNAFSNSFSGPLPPQLSQIETLKVLNLAGSYFSGPIPPEFGSFKSLEFIHLAGNFLSGSIPPELGKLQTLTHMEIGYNSYEGGIPWQLGNMSRIEYLDIAGAGLSGSIPDEIGNLTRLQSLFLFRNHLDGQIPPEFRNLVSLKSLDLSDNLISGQIPGGFSELKNLSLLSLFYNDMNGSVPQGIAELPLLESLLLWNNFFSGSLPQSLGRNSKLKLVDVSTNNFNGTIPPDICANRALNKLIIFSNNFSGELPPSLSECSSLVRIRVEDNSLTGVLPLKFGSLPEITYVDLSQNKFKGGISADISNASKLEYFNASNNAEFGGIIPLGIWSLPNLHNFSASSCDVAGDLPSFQQCKSVFNIELSSNRLTGSIPDSISSCQALERIDLSKNHLSGPIPENISSSSHLAILNVSFNDISGSIPHDKLFSSMPRSAFEGNRRLCGVPLDKCSKPREVDAEFLWVLVLCAVVVIFIALSVSALYYIQRARRSRQWKVLSFSGMPKFSPDEFLKSLDATHCTPISKTLLPTGVTVTVKKIEWEMAHDPKAMMGFVTQMGNARHKNIVRLLGCCYNDDLAYLLYDYSPNGNLSERITVKKDWDSKYKAVIGIARGLCYLHHECYPAIPHGDLRTDTVSFNENMELQLSEFGFGFLLHFVRGPYGSTTLKAAKTVTDELNAAMEEALCEDVYRFGELVLEILNNGKKITNAKKRIQDLPREVVFKEVERENQADKEELQRVVEVVLMCTRSNPLERPSMEYALKILSGIER